MNTPEHATVWQLLPWHAAGRLAAADEQAVVTHLLTCAACRAELAWQRELHAAAASADHAAPVPAMDAALARLLPRLEEAPAAAFPFKMPRVLAALVTWLQRIPALPAALAVALVALSVTLPSSQGPAYQGLGPVPAAGGTTTVVFRPDTAASDVKRILAATGAQAVHGPTVAGAYVLAVGPARRPEVLARLRAEPAVLMAEPLDGREVP